MGIKTVATVGGTSAVGFFAASLVAPKMMANPPSWLQGVLLAVAVVCILVPFVWSLLGRKGGDGEGGVTTNNPVARAAGANALAGIHNSTVTINQGVQDATQPRKYPRGMPPAEPPARRPRKCPPMLIWKAVEYIRNVIGDNDEKGCYPETLRQIRDAARHERIEIWGRREIPPDTHSSPERWDDLWEPIEPEYWRDFELNSMATGEAWGDHDHTWSKTLPSSGRTKRYKSLKVDQSEIEQEWPPVPSKIRLVDRAAAKPDIKLPELLERAMVRFGPTPDLNVITSEIADLISVNELHVWARFYDRPIQPLDLYDWNKGSLNVLHNELKVAYEFGVSTYTDLRFNRREIDEHWPSPEATGETDAAGK